LFLYGTFKFVILLINSTISKGIILLVLYSFDFIVSSFLNKTPGRARYRVSCVFNSKALSICESFIYYTPFIMYHFIPFSPITSCQRILNELKEYRPSNVIRTCREFAPPPIYNVGFELSHRCNPETLYFCAPFTS